MLTHDFISSVYKKSPTSKIMDNNRNCLRRIASHQETEFSSQSIMKAMEKFVQAVQDMDETILVPCRLMDLQVGEATDKVEVKFAQKGDGIHLTDLHSLYSLVNCVKTELLWGANNQHHVEDNHIPISATPTMKTHIRRPSTASMASTNSAGSTISDTDSEIGMENDSGIEGDSESNTKSNYTLKVENSFRRHLYGLHRSLEQMTEAAVYLTKRYQNDVLGTV
uniref:Mid1-interacting protein 1 n=1 Tax=Clastoptera arizonana TaxID=38151 RepID=A0A1B6CI15_9HEMI